MGKRRAQSRPLERAMIGYGQGCASAVCFDSSKRNVIPAAHNGKTENSEHAQHPLKRSVTGNLAMLWGKLNSDSESNFGYESLEHRTVLGRSKRFSSERLDMESNCRAHVGKRFFIGIALAENCPAPDPEGIGDVPIQMLLYD
jgi:hypothetical protein